MADNVLENPSIELTDNTDFPVTTSLDGTEYLFLIYPDGSGGWIPKKILTANMGVNEGGGNLYTSITLTKAQIASLNSSPVDFIAAPGSGKAISITQAYAYLNIDGTVFTGANGDLKLNYVTTPTAAASIGSLITSSANDIKRIGNTNDLELNQKIVIANNDNDFGGGGANATLTIQCFYRILDFN